MRIRKINIKNFRSIVECDFDFNNLVTLLGENNCGKSNVLAAIEMFLKKTKVNGEFDFNKKDLPIEIDVTFGDLTDFEKEKLIHHIENDTLRLIKRFYFKTKEDGSPDSESKITSKTSEGENNVTPQNIFAGETLPEIYSIPAVRDVCDETKNTGTTNFGKFLDLLFNSSDDYDFSTVDRVLDEINTEIKRADDNAPLVKAANEIGLIMKKQFKNSEILFNVETQKRKDLLSKIEVYLNDGFNSPIQTKGNGTQRALIFSILLVYAIKLNQKIALTNQRDKKDIIITIEEPEIYLHPQQQRVIYKLFKELTNNIQNQIQIIYTTHSSFMFDISDYKNLCFLNKSDLNTGTKVSQCVENIFSEDERIEFQFINQFDPERNEMFFADKIILCEGDTEKNSLPILLDKLGINPIENKITIVECGNKENIRLFQKVINKFNVKFKVFKYVVFYDTDLRPNLSLQETNHASELNSEIEGLLDGNTSFPLNYDFESYFNLTLGRSKPYSAKKQISMLTVNQVPTDFIDFIHTSFNN